MNITSDEKAIDQAGISAPDRASISDNAVNDPLWKIFHYNTCWNLYHLLIIVSFYLLGSLPAYLKSHIGDHYAVLTINNMCSFFFDSDE